jgi:hypothetical protein
VEGVERPKRNLSIKAIVMKKQSTPNSPAVVPTRIRANTDTVGILETIKEVKLNKEDEKLRN